MEKGINTQKTTKSFNRRYYEGFCDMIGKIDKGTIRPDERISLTIGELKILFDENSLATLEIATNELDKK